MGGAELANPLVRQTYSTSGATVCGVWLILLVRGGYGSWWAAEEAWERGLPDPVLHDHFDFIPDLGIRCSFINKLLFQSERERERHLGCVIERST